MEPYGLVDFSASKVNELHGIFLRYNHRDHNGSITATLRSGVPTKVCAVGVTTTNVIM